MTEHEEALKRFRQNKLNLNSTIPFREGNQSKIYKIHSEFDTFIYKVPAGSNFIVKTINAFLIKREYKVLKQIQHIKGVPEVFSYNKGIFMKFYEGVNIRDFMNSNTKIKNEFHAQLLQTIQDLHSEGIAHCDLKRKENILILNDQSFVILDFGISYRYRNRLFKPLFNLLKQTDLNAYIKIKYDKNYNNLSDDDKKIYKLTRIEKILKKYFS